MPEGKQSVPGVTLGVRVIPRAPQDAIVGWQAGALKVRLQAPPVEGRANAALIRLLSAALGIPRADVVLLTGAKARGQRVLLRGVTVERLAAVVNAHIGQSARTAAGEGEELHHV